MNHDDLEVELGDAMHRMAGAVSTTVPTAGRELVDRHVRKRAVRRRRNLSAGAVAAVAVLAGGVIALRPDPAQHVKFANAPADKTTAPGSAVATGYATGSMSGSPTGWTAGDSDPSTVALPKVIAQLDSTWTPDGVYANSISQGKGTAAGPVVILADQSAAQPRFLVVSVQTPRTLGPGHGGQTFASNGLSGRIISDNGSGVVVIVDIPGGQRVEAKAVGIDRATVLQLIATLHQQAGAWTMDPSGGLSAVATTPLTSSTSRSLTWTKGDPTNAADPSSQSVTVTVTTGGAYEFYGEAVQAGTGPYNSTSSIKTVLGHQVVASLVSTQAGSVNTLLLDDQGLVYDLLQVDDAPGATAPTTPLTLAVASDSEWTTLVNAAAVAQAAQQQAAVARKESAMARAKAGGDPASAAKALGLNPPTTVPPAGLATTTTVSATS